MPKVSTTHPQYDALAADRKKCRDATKGASAIRGAGDTYIPKLTGLSEEEWQAYLARGTWFGATGRTVEFMVGSLFRKDPAVDIPPEGERFQDAVTPGGRSLIDLSSYTATEVAQVGVLGLLADFPDASTEGLTIQQAELAGLRPYLSTYVAENIINWTFSTGGGAKQLTKVVLRESILEPDDNDEFSHVQVEQFRVLDLFEGRYRVRLFRKATKGQDFLQIAEFYPKQAGQPMKEIPFVVITPDESEDPCGDLVILDLAEVNVGHWRNSADHENGLHYCGIPMPVIIGIEDTTQKIHVGGHKALLLPPDGDAKYLEFTGKGLDALESAMTKKERQMAALGARMLMEEKNAAESGEAIGRRQAGEQSVLSKLAGSVGRGITKAMQHLLAFAGIQGDVSIVINRDFVALQLDGDRIRALLEAYQGSAISAEVLFWNLKQGEVIPDELDFETHEAQKEENPPVSVRMTALPVSDEEGETA